MLHTEVFKKKDSTPGSDMKADSISISKYKVFISG